jgi:hypothetical protein
VKIVITVNDDSAEAVALLTRYYLEGLVRQNVWLMHRLGPLVPPLYQSGVRFRLEPWARQVQHFANAVEILDRGWADCKGLSAYRCAEARKLAKTPAEARGYGLKIYWRLHDVDPLHAALGAAEGPAAREYRIYHVQVRHPDGSVEDPSRMLHQ